MGQFYIYISFCLQGRLEPTYFMWDFRLVFRLERYNWNSLNWTRVLNLCHVDCRVSHSFAGQIGLMYKPWSVLVSPLLSGSFCHKIIGKPIKIMTHLNRDYKTSVVISLHWSGRDLVGIPATTIIPFWLTNHSHVYRKTVEILIHRLRDLLYVFTVCKI